MAQKAPAAAKVQTAVNVVSSKPANAVVKTTRPTFASNVSDNFYISAETLQGIQGLSQGSSMNYSSQATASVAGAGDKAIAKRTSKSNLLENHSRTNAVMMTDRVAMMTRQTQTEMSALVDDNDENWNLKVKMVELFEEADRRAKSDSDKRIAAQCLRMFVSMLDAVTNSPHASKSSTSKSLPALSAAKLPTDGERGSMVDARSNGKPSAHTDWDDQSSQGSSPVGGRGSKTLLAGPGRTPQFRPGAFRSSDQAKYTPHDDDDDDDVEEEMATAEDDELSMQELEVPSSVRSAGSVSSRGSSGKKGGDSVGRYRATAPGVRPRVGHLEEDSEISEPPKSKFLEDMEAEERERKKLAASPSIRPSPAARRATTQFQVQFPSGDGDDESGDEHHAAVEGISSALYRVRFGDEIRGTPTGSPRTMKEMDVALNDGTSEKHHEALWKNHRGGNGLRRTAGHTPGPPLRTTYNDDEEDEDEAALDEEEFGMDDKEEEDDENIEDAEYDSRFEPFPRSRPTLGASGTPRGAGISGGHLSRRRPPILDDPGMLSIVGMLNGMQLGDPSAAAAVFHANGGEPASAPSPAVADRMGRVAIRKHGQAEIRVGPDEVDGGTCVVLTPRRASKKEREELGVDSVVTSARRSLRLFREDILKPTTASMTSTDSEEVPTTMTKDEKFIPYHSSRIGNLQPYEMAQVHQILDNHGLAYVPNERLQEEPIPSARPTGFLNHNRTHYTSATTTAPSLAIKTAAGRTPRTAAVMADDEAESTPASGGANSQAPGSATVGPRDVRRANVLTPGGSRANVMVQGGADGTPLTRSRSALLKTRGVTTSALDDPEATPRASRS
ncbi:hypothetical protein BC829DRAFT_383024 [Chytridium lagenaria]|nr:hypothetical protein BC829DRAFT_383024 [Chytridium lagenaria]